MAFEVTMDGDLMRILLFDSLTDGDLRGLAEAVMVIEATQKTTPSRIADMTELVRFDVGFNSVDALAARRRESRVVGPTKTALLVTNELQFGVARMYQTLNDHPQITTRIFRDREAAMQWLAE